MSSMREIEVNIPSACTYLPAWLDASTWTVSLSSQSDYPCNMLQPGTTIRIMPMTRQFGGWDEAHFHPNLRLPLGCNAGAGVTVMLEAMASECIAVALSPDSQFVMGKTYVVHFGASGNVSTVIRRRLPSANEAVDVQIASRVCANDSWVRYWLCLVGGKLFVGVGMVPGEQCIGVLDDSLYNQLRSGLDAVRFVGLGNSAVGKSPRFLKVRQVVVTTVPVALRTFLESLDTNGLPMVNIDAAIADNDTRAMMEAYEMECKKAKARAIKFGIPYKEPNPEAFLDWSKAKRLRSNPQQGFATGIDMMSPEEQERQRARAERFGINTAKRERDNEADDHGYQNEDQMDAVEDLPLAMAEAWDNEELVRQHRTDPPKELWVSPPEDAVEEENDRDMFDSEPIKLTEEKIHIFSVDWSAFKQIRTDDVLAHFSAFGPSYVEWLGEISCNVHFLDKFSSARAMQGLSQPILSPPPDEVVARFEDITTPDFGRMGWRFCLRPMRKVANDRYGRRGTTARILMRVATTADVLLEKPSSTPAPPPGFSAKRILGPGSDFDTGHRQKRRKRESRNEEREEVNTYPEGEGDHPLLSQSLRSGRDGYSLEDLEAERARTNGNVAS